MTRDEWIAEARVLLADDPRARDLLAATPEISIVVEAEIVEEPEPERREAIVTLHAPRDDQLEKLTRRASRFAHFMADEGDEAPLRGSARLGQKIGKAYEDGLDKVLDKLEQPSQIAPALDRSAAFGRHRK